ncbi:unnamed protein product [Cyclocybe aegerita]|uniref:Uncharacterized protein n=1 Tax=Cyclocybe aegerita TaxID=1973307 RepID=A0A8S0WDJ3_CYCAE|nr:unnamed protein product [Cyclocybe aegerita]
MENTHLPGIEDDVFGSRDAPNQRLSPSRNHFTPSDPISTRPIRHRPEVQKTHTGLTPPVRRGSPLNPQNIAQAEARRRSRPPDVALPSSDSSSRHRRTVSHSLGTMARIPDFFGGALGGQDAELEVGVFSNEYDLAHEDPMILEDVQRAIRLKARREARMKRDSALTPEKPIAHPASPSSPHSITPSRKPLPSFSPSPSPSFSPSSSRKLSNSTSSDVDFSPSTGAEPLPPLHPIPASLDNGMTLDWTGTPTDDSDKRWAISIGKKKEKDKMLPLGVIIDQQEKTYQEKLARIRNLASSQTTRKANITTEQLGRRYDSIYKSLEKKVALNLAGVARWYSAQEDGFHDSLEKAEPFTWLKHLEKHSADKKRSPWILSALVMEEYCHAQEHQSHMQTIPEDSTLPNSDASYPRKSRPASFLSATRVLTDDPVSFEPLAESKRNSFDAMSRKSAESTLGSVRSGSSHPSAPLSPIPSRIAESTKDSQPTTIPEDAPTSTFEMSEEELATVRKPQSTTTALVIPGVSVHPPSSESATTNAPTNIPVSQTTSTASSGSSQRKPVGKNANQSLASLKTSLKYATIGASSPRPKAPKTRTKKEREAREERLRQEYEMKANMLREVKHYNERARKLLARMANLLKEYDEARDESRHDFDAALPRVPQDVLEASVHDPSGTTSNPKTRRTAAWRYVEDIHHRIARQRKLFTDFIESFPDYVSNEGCFLDDTIESALRTLDILRNQKAEVTRDSAASAELLGSVQQVHAEVKDKYNQTVAQASVIYPELSHIVALEESYKDQYQQFWELGMDALTLLLDTVTPFWRTYGKRIGEDVRDFLIIPLYRNEFTGEARKYPIKRSLDGHFAIGAAISSSKNFRLHSIPYHSVRWTALPFFWIGIIIQWFAVIIEFAIVFMQLVVIAWWTGWFVKLLS